MLPSSSHPGWSTKVMESYIPLVGTTDDCNCLSEGGGVVETVSFGKLD